MDGKVSLTFEDFGAAAAALNLPPAAVQAVHRVETAGRSGFLAPGLPEILFEGHIFWQRLKRRGIEPAAWQEGNGDILYPRWTREHYEGGKAEYRRLARALRIHEEAALESTSWGMFQVMGFNHAACGKLIPFTLLHRLKIALVCQHNLRKGELRHRDGVRLPCAKHLHPTLQKRPSKVLHCACGVKNRPQMWEIGLDLPGGERRHPPGGKKHLAFLCKGSMLFKIGSSEHRPIQLSKR